MVATSSVCICLTVCEVFYLCGKRFRECSRGRFHPGREDSFLVRVPLNPASKEPVLAGATPADHGDGEAFSPAPAYAAAVSSSSD